MTEKYVNNFLAHHSNVIQTSKKKFEIVVITNFYNNNNTPTKLLVPTIIKNQNFVTHIKIFLV